MNNDIQYNAFFYNIASANQVHLACW